MTQTSDLGAIPNQSRTDYRGAVNTNIQALATHHSGGSAPPVTYPYMIWFDTSGNAIKLRNSTNTAWSTVGTLSPFSWAAVSATSGYLGTGTLSGSSVTLTGIPSGAVAVDITLVAVTHNATGNLGLQLGTSGGLVTTGYAATGEELGSTTATTSTSMILTLQLPSSAVTLGTARLFHSAGNRWSMQSICGSTSAAVNNTIAFGSVVLGGTLDRVAITCTASMTGGVMQLRWYT